MGGNNSRLTTYLKQNDFDPKTLNDKKLFNSDKRTYFRNVDRYQDLLEAFGQNNFSNGRKVIVEGVQLMDETMYPTNLSLTTNQLFE